MRQPRNSIRSLTVLLTRLGGGAFGNAGAWIDDAIIRSLEIVEHAGPHVRPDSQDMSRPRCNPLPTNRGSKKRHCAKRHSPMPVVDNLIEGPPVRFADRREWAISRI